MLNQSTIVRGGERPAFWLLNDHLQPLLDAEHSSGQLTIALHRVHPGGGPPPHVHANDDEAFFVLEGEVHVRNAR